MSNTPILSLPNKTAILKSKGLTVINRIMANYLAISEEIVDEHDDAMTKLEDALPSEYKTFVRLADYLPDTKNEARRSRILRVGNDARRELEETIDALRLEDSK
jgi:hypothetical protein